MLILTTKSYCLDDLTLNNPESYKGTMFCELQSSNKGLVYIQTPKLFFSKTSDPDKLRIILDNHKKTKHIGDFYSMLKLVEDKICELLSQNSKTWFSSFIPSAIIRDNLFRRTIDLPKEFGSNFSFEVGIPKDSNGEYDIEVFNTEKEKKSYDDIFSSGSGECTFLLGIKEVSVESNKAQIIWEVVQVLIHKKKNKIKGFGIVSDDAPLEKIKIGIIGPPEPVQEPVLEPQEPDQEPGQEPETLDSEEPIQEPEPKTQEPIQESEEPKTQESEEPETQEPVESVEHVEPAEDSDSEYEEIVVRKKKKRHGK